MSIVYGVALGLLGVAGVLCLLRLVRGPGVPDRIVALDALLVVVLNAVVVQAARTGDGTYLLVLAVVALVGFTGTVTAARFVERRGA